MKLHLLTFTLPTNPDSATKQSLDLLVDAAAKQGYVLELIHAKRCWQKFGKKSEVLIDGKKRKDIKVLIVKPTFPGKDVDIHSNLIRQFEMTGTEVINGHVGVIRAKNKLRTHQILSEAGVPMPKTYVVRSAEYIEEAVEDIGKYPVIMKSVSGLGGIGVTIAESERGLRSVVEMLTDEAHSAPLIIQQYEKEAKGKDTRVFIVGNKIVAAMERVATKKGEFRSNFHLGGKVKLTALSQKEKSVALAAAAACKLDIAGVDIIRTKSGPKVLEVNSNPGLVGITQATGIDVAGEIIKYAAKKAKKKKSKKRVNKKET